MTHPDPSCARPGRTPLSARLDREWSALRRRPDALARASSWQLLAHAVVDLDEVLAATGYRAAAGPAAAPAQNALLGHLARRAGSDELAARIVLQRILPGLLADIARRSRRSDGAHELFEELVGSAWIVVRAGRLGPRSHHVAATLVRDACHRAFTAPRRRKSWTEIAVDPRAFQREPAPVAVSSFEELAGIVGEARRRGLPTEDVTLVRDLVRLGSPARLAGERKVTTRTVRNHRDRAVHSLRRLAAEVVELAPHLPAA